MDVCDGKSAWPSERQWPVAGSKRKLLGLLMHEVRCEDRLLGKENNSLTVCLSLNPASTRKKLDSG